MPELPQLRKYPRTRHLEGSRVQAGDEDLDCVLFQELAGRYVVVEEKIDGANAALSFSPSGTLLLQSRGHYLTGGARERHFALFKRWAHHHASTFWEVLGEQYILYGEWLYARHTIFYNLLPHYFLEFDVFDRNTGQFLSTTCRRALLHGLPLRSVPVLREGRFDTSEKLVGEMAVSGFISADHLAGLRESCLSLSIDPERVLNETDPSTLMEGLYIKVEENGIVQERCKFIRPSFLSAVLDSGSHWLSRPIIPNQLAPGAQLF